MRIFAIYGAGGCGRGIIPLAREQLETDAGCSLVFVDDGAAGSTINGHKVLSFDEFSSADADRYVAIAIADSKIRSRLADKCADAGVKPFSVWASNAVRMDDV
jgi:hypothetical protein